MADRVGAVRLGIIEAYKAANKFHGRHGAWHQLTSLLKDEVSPGFTLIGPTADSVITKNTPIIFTLTDADVNSPLKTYAVNMRFNSIARTELIYRSPVDDEEVDFDEDYVEDSYVSNIPYGLLFALQRKKGWVDASISLKVTATDALGNVMEPVTVSWTVSNPANPHKLIVIET